MEPLQEGDVLDNKYHVERVRFLRAARALSVAWLAILALAAFSATACVAIDDRVLKTGADGGLPDVAQDGAPGDVSSRDTRDTGDTGCTGPGCAVCGNTMTDPQDCGACGHHCTTLQNVVASAGVTCTAGKCMISPSACAPGYGHCTSDPDDGCETDLGSSDHSHPCATACK